MFTARRIGREAATAVAIALLYALAAQLGFRVAPLHPVVATVWPPAGLALAVLLLGGARLWPGVFLGALTANALHGIPLPFAALMGVGNSLSGVLAASQLRRTDFQMGLTRARDILLLLTVGAVGAPLVSASVGTASLYLSGGISAGHLAPVWLNWWSGDSIGVILVTPLLAAWARRGPARLSARMITEGAVVLSLLLVVSVVLLGRYHEFKYAIFVLAGWIAVRYGLRGGTISIALIAAVALWHVTHGQNPFGGAGSLGLWRFQIFVALLSMGSLVTATMATALRSSELRFRRIFDSAGVGMAVVQPDGTITAANPALHTMLGYPGTELNGRTIADITHAEDWAAERTVIGKVLTGQSSPYRVVKRYLRLDGSAFWGKLTATHVPDGDHGPGSAIKLVEELSERATHLLQTLNDAAPLAILAIDPEGRVRSWNRAAEQMFGWSEEEALGTPVPFVPAESFAAFRASLDRVLGGESLTGLQVRRARRDGVMLDLRICAAPTRSPDGAVDGIISIAEDVTERKRMGEQLRQAQKMEAIGELTGGIAHDFNNLLTIVLTNAALLSDRIAPDQTDARVEVGELHRAATRGAELVRKLMTFSRRRDLELAPINLGEVLCDTERSLRRLLPKSVELITQLEAEGPLVIDGDVGAIEQIVFNLATNARDAMPEGGTLRLALYRAWLDPEHRRTHGWGTSGEYVVLAVSDTGCGMSRETRARVFEPFYTTKGPGKGTGLGMAMVYGLIKQHNGYISLYSEVGHGTTFCLYFPAVESAQAAPAVKTEAQPAGGTERILVVDDEDGLRRSAARVLRRAGYTVVEASDGESALALLSEAEPPFELVLSDVVMPRMGGLALHEELRKRGFLNRFIFMSGYAADDVRALAKGQRGLKFLHKPWSITDLLRRVRGVLDEPAPI